MAQTIGSGTNSGKSWKPPKYKKPPAITAPSGGKPPTAGLVGVTATPKPKGRPKGGGGGGGGGGGRSSGNGVGSNSSGQISAAPPPPPPPPTLEAFLGSDATYLQQKAAFDKAKSDYLSQQGQSRTQYETNFLSDKDTLTKNRTQSLGDLENDYASRGLLQSGLYADSMANMNTDYDKRTSALEQAKAAFLAGLANDLTNFTSEQGLMLTKAQQEAAARRSAQYGA